MPHQVDYPDDDYEPVAGTCSMSRYSYPGALSPKVPESRVLPQATHDMPPGPPTRRLLRRNGVAAIWDRGHGERNAAAVHLLFNVWIRTLDALRHE
jgi:hypothetical protein